MSDLGVEELPFAPTEELETLGLTPEEVVGPLQADLDELDSVTTVDEALSRIDRLSAGLSGQFGETGGGVVSRLLNALRSAYETGAVPPSETTAAVSWVIGNAGTNVLIEGAAAQESLDSWFLLYAVDHGHTVKPTSSGTPVAYAAPPAGPVAPSVPVARTRPAPPVIQPSLTVSVPDPTSPGGKIVTAAEKGLKRVSVRVPGMSGAEARGVSLALAATYQDTLSVLARSVDAIEGQIEGIATQVAAVDTRARDGAAGAAGAERVLTRHLETAERRIESLVSSIGNLQGELTNLQKQIEGVATQAPTTAGGAGQGAPSGLSPADLALIATIPTLATTAALSRVQDEADATAGEVAGLSSELQSQYVPNLPGTIEGLIDCCTENGEITDPIRAGGATPSLLGSLGSLLGLGYFITFAAGIVETVLAVVDMPDTIFGVTFGGEQIASWAGRATDAIASDLTWSGTLHG